MHITYTRYGLNEVLIHTNNIKWQLQFIILLYIIILYTLLYLIMIDKYERLLQGIITLSTDAPCYFRSLSRYHLDISIIHIHKSYDYHEQPDTQGNKVRVIRIIRLYIYIYTHEEPDTQGNKVESFGDSHIDGLARRSIHRTLGCYQGYHMSGYHVSNQGY